MKLCRFRRSNETGTGLVLEHCIAPLAPLGENFASMRGIIAQREEGLEAIHRFAQGSPATIPLSTVELLAPIERPGKYLAIGMNYGSHAQEAERLGIEKRSYQTWFNKQTSCLSGPYDPIDPGVTEQLDYEAELAAVIGREAKYVSAEDAPAHVFGYTVANDVSARDWQFHTSTFTMGKSFDTHGPIGPWIVTADEVPDPHALDIRCYVNGELRQSSNTSNMINDLWSQIAYLSTAFTLEPGDLIATGTPEGVGVALDPPVFLQPGDVVRCEIQGIGAIENKVIAPTISKFRGELPCR